MNNFVRHSKGDRVLLLLRKQNKAVDLWSQDNGTV